PDDKNFLEETDTNIEDAKPVASGTHPRFIPALMVFLGASEGRPTIDDVIRTANNWLIDQDETELSFQKELLASIDNLLEGYKRFNRAAPEEMVSKAAQLRQSIPTLEAKIQTKQAEDAKRLQAQEAERARRLQAEQAEQARRLAEQAKRAQRIKELQQELAQLQKEKAFQEDLLAVYKKHNRSAEEIKKIEDAITSINEQIKVKQAEIAALEPGKAIAQVSAETPSPEVTPTMPTKADAQAKGTKTASQAVTPQPATATESSEIGRVELLIPRLTLNYRQTLEVDMWQRHIEQWNPITPYRGKTPDANKRENIFTVAGKVIVLPLHVVDQAVGGINEVLACIMRCENLAQAEQKLATTEKWLIDEALTRARPEDQLDIQLIRTHHNNGNIYYLQHRYKEATREYEKAFDFDPVYAAQKEKINKEAKDVVGVIYKGGRMFSGLYLPAWIAFAIMDGTGEAISNENFDRILETIEEAKARQQAMATGEVTLGQWGLGVPTLFRSEFDMPEPGTGTGAYTSFWESPEESLRATVPVYLGQWEIGVAGIGTNYKQFRQETPESPIITNYNWHAGFDVSYFKFNHGIGKRIVVTQMGPASGREFPYEPGNPKDKGFIEGLLKFTVNIVWPFGKQGLYYWSFSGGAPKDMKWATSGVDTLLGIGRQVGANNTTGNLIVDPTYYALKDMSSANVGTLMGSLEIGQEVSRDLFNALIFYPNYYRLLADPNSFFRAAWGRNSFIAEPFLDPQEAAASQLSKENLVKWLFNHPQYIKNLKWDNRLKQFVLWGTVYEKNYGRPVMLSSRTADGKDLYIYRELMYKGKYFGLAAIHFDGEGNLIEVTITAKDGSQVSVRGTGAEQEYKFITKNKHSGHYTITTWKSGKLQKIERFNSDWLRLIEIEEGGLSRVFIYERGSLTRDAYDKGAREIEMSIIKDAQTIARATGLLDINGDIYIPEVNLGNKNVTGYWRTTRGAAEADLFVKGRINNDGTFTIEAVLAESKPARGKETLGNVTVQVPAGSHRITEYDKNGNILVVKIVGP
ncbi:MAG: hypothetical protein PHG40_05475, partial [Candidatus Omnitrophica bacterium]|nr:hypothetical protein [Candidatus Omnitrophota bacterium]